ncbi:unnamed protein product [Mycena citricolor]|uniref:Uncharacterized protein n=1 Tax=Mycena citricolor TaxID=2018698 RepID=A0AAD2HPM1_9AGAR|nr:unnamed protein product [Mycena citricolor]
MVSHRLEPPSKQKKALHVEHRDRIQRVSAFVVCLGAAATVIAAASSEKEAMHTSPQTGQKWVDELLVGMSQLDLCWTGYTGTDHTVMCLTCRSQGPLQTCHGNVQRRFQAFAVGTDNSLRSTSNKACIT